MWRTRTLIAAFILACSAQATDHIVPSNDVAGFFANLPKGATRMVFPAAVVYTCDADIVLPMPNCW